VVKTDSIAKALSGGYLQAIDLAEYLVGKGVPFRQSHRIVGELVSYAMENGKALAELSGQELRKFSRHFGDEATRLFDVNESVRRKSSYGGTSPRSVAAQIRSWKTRLSKEQ
jgi:argininosuccinate lyase